MTKIMNITIENFRPFFGINNLEFSSDSNKNFNVVFAGTGSGKTSVLDAISWCLFGKEYHKQLPKDTLLNDKKRDELKKEKIADVRVEIIMGEKQNNIEFIFNRKISFIKKSDKSVTILPSSEKFHAKLKDARNNLIDAADPSVVVNWVFPERIHHLFMFDGEKLQDFFETDNIKNTEHAIKDITQMDQLDNAVAHLIHSSKEFLTKEEMTDPQIQQLEDFIDSVRKRVQDNRLEEESRKISLEEAKKAFEAADEQLKRIDFDDKGLLEEERSIQGRISNSELKIKEIEINRFHHLLQGIPTIFCKKELERAVQKIDKKYESGELPSDVKVEFINKLLEKQRCICKTPLIKGSEARKFVEAYKNAAPLSNYEDEIRHGQAEIKSMLKEINQFFEKRVDYYKQLEETKQSLDDDKQRFESIKKKTESINNPEIQRLRSLKSFHLGEMQRYNKEIGGIQNKISEDEDAILKLGKQKMKLEKESIKNKAMREKYEICEKALSFLENTQKNLLVELKKDIEQRTNSIFKESVIEPRVKEVIISDFYECQVLDTSGLNIYPTLSSGQKQGLATAFMIALRRDSGFDSPILIDYPFGRIDPRSTAEFIDVLKKILADVQVIFFLIEGKEYSDSVKAQMQDRLGSLYEICKLKDEKMSEVIKHARN